MYGNSASSKREKEAERVKLGSKRSRKQEQADITSESSCLQLKAARSANAQGMNIPRTQCHVHVLQKQG
jgi:hypothetical protein